MTIMGQKDNSTQVELKGLYSTSGVSLIIAGLLVLATLPLIPLMIPSLAPSSVQSGLDSIHSQSLLYGVTWGLYLVSDLAYLIPFLAFYTALKLVNRTGVLVAAVFNTLFVTIDVGIDIPLRLSLIGLSNSYASLQYGSPLTPYLVTAQLTMDLANITALVATFLQFSALILASYVILESKMFRKVFAYAGVGGGVLGLLFIPAFIFGSMLSGLFNIGGFVLLVIWSLGTGYSIYRKR